MFDRSRRNAARLVLIAALALAGLGTAPLARAATTITVNTTADETEPDGKCSLREAIAAADNNSVVTPGAGECPAGSGDDTVVVPAGTYLLSRLDADGGFAGDLDIRSEMTVRGSGAGSTIIDANRIGRVFDIRPGGDVAIDGLTMRDGLAPSGRDGLNGADNAGGAGGDGEGGGDGQSGGGIRNLGTLAVNSVVIIDNIAGTGGAGGYGGRGTTPGEGGRGGEGGDGGGIANYGTLTVTASTVSSNYSGFGGSNGVGGDGYSHNAAGSGGLGGGIYNDFAATLRVVDSTISANVGGDGGRTNGVFAGFGSLAGSGGSGGGMYSRGTLTMTGSTISSNHSGNGGQSLGEGGGGGGAGGLAAHGASTITNTTISSNHAGDGSPGSLGQPGGSGGWVGGVNAGPASTLVHVTIARNTPGVRGGATGGGGFGSPGEIGGISGQGTLANSIVADNGDRQCDDMNRAGPIVDGGHNVSFPDTTCPGLHAYPDLQPLAFNGGPTKTHALGFASAAIDQVPRTGAGCPAIDQRGVARPQGPACDAGAFELVAGVPAASLTPSSLGFGNARVGTTTNAQNLTLSSTGTATLQIASIGLAGVNPGDYLQSNNCPSALTPGMSCTIAVRFRPAASGVRTAAVRVVDNAASSPQQSTLSGRGCNILIGSLCL